MHDATIAMPPFFSIVTITLNNIAGLRNTERSVASQTFTDYEWVIVDGNSSDGTTQYLREIKNKHINWHSERDAGLYDAMNKGINRSTGRYLLFLNAGDEFSEENVLSTAHRLLAPSTIDVLYGDSLERDEFGNTHYKKSFSHHAIYYSMFTHHQSIFYNRNSIGSLRYNTDLRISGDRALTAQLYVQKKKFVYFAEPVCIFESGGISQSKDPVIRNRMYQERMYVLREILHLPGFVAAALLSIKRMADFLRSKSPGLYNALRFRKKRG